MLLLGVAFSSSIGSITTLIASPPNLIYAEIVNELFGQNYYIVLVFSSCFTGNYNVDDIYNIFHSESKKGANG